MKVDFLDTCLYMVLASLSLTMPMTALSQPRFSPQIDVSVRKHTDVEARSLAITAPIDGTGKYSASQFDYTGSWIEFFGEGNGVYDSDGEIGDVYALAADSNGAIYVGGNFEKAGTQTVNNIAVWSDGEWSALGEGFNDAVFSILISSNNDIYAGGRFSKSGIANVTRAAIWRQGHWKSLISSIQNDSNIGAIFVLAEDAYSNEIYAGGEFTSIDNQVAHGIAKWNGTTWSGFPDDFEGSGCVDTSLDNVYSIHVYNGLYVAGNILRSISSDQLNGVARWELSNMTWAPIGSGVDVGKCQSINTVTSFNDDIVMSSSHSIFNTGLESGVSNVVDGENKYLVSIRSDTLVAYPTVLFKSLDGKYLYIGAPSIKADNVVTNGAARWNDSGLHTFEDGLNQNATVFAVAETSEYIYFGGKGISTASGTPSHGIAVWRKAIPNTVDLPHKSSKDISERINISGYPNPFNDYLNLRIHGEAINASDIKINVFSLDGREVYSGIDYSTNNSADLIVLDLKPFNIPPGAYVFNFTFGNQQISTVAVKLHH